MRIVSSASIMSFFHRTLHNINELPEFSAVNSPTYVKSELRAGDGRSTPETISLLPVSTRHVSLCPKNMNPHPKAKYTAISDPNEAAEAAVPNSSISSGRNAKVGAPSKPHKYQAANTKNEAPIIVRSEPLRFGSTKLERFFIQFQVSPI